MAFIAGIDIGSIPYGRGVSRYTSNLVRGLLELHGGPVLRMFGASFRQRDELLKFVAAAAPSSKSVILPHPARLMHTLWNTLHLLSPEIFLGKLDVFHSWEMQPPLKKAALVSTIHDLAMIRYPETADQEVLNMHKASWKWLKKEAKAIIAVSEATRMDIIELLDIEPERVHVVHEALPVESRIVLTQIRAAEYIKKYNLTKPYLFFIGTMEPRKNLKRLIAAWRPLKKDVELVIAGAAGWETVQKETGLHVVGKVNDEALASLIQSAEALVYPSIYEGFGLPILQGFYAKIPVVTSNCSSMAEIAGDAAVLVQPLDVESIRKGLETALQSKEKYVRAGLQRLRKFQSWTEVASNTFKVYKKAIGS